MKSNPEATTTMVWIKGDKQPELIEVPSIKVCDGIVIHLATNDSTTWSVTHAMTGRAIAQYVPSKDIATKIARHYAMLSQSLGIPVMTDDPDQIQKHPQYHELVNHLKSFQRMLVPF